MIDGDFEVGGYLLGRDHPVFVESVDPGAVEVRDQDALNPVGSNRYFGTDYLTPSTWTLGLGVNRFNAADGLAVLSDLVRLWRSRSSEVLKYRIAGRTRFVYGRPRAFSYDPNLVESGHIAATAEFVTSDPLHYDDTQRSTGRITLLPSPSGGVRLPATLPFTLSKAVPRQGLIDDVGGDAPAPVRVVVHGPLTGKWSVTVGGHRIEMVHSLAYDRSVMIDTRTLAVRGDDGSNLSGKVSRRVFLPDVRLLPGASDVVFEGNDMSGTSWCEVTWHPAFYGF